MCHVTEGSHNMRKNNLSYAWKLTLRDDIIGNGVGKKYCFLIFPCTRITLTAAAVDAI